MYNDISAISSQLTSSSKTKGNSNTGWYVQMAKAWGAALDHESQKLVDLSKGLNESSSIGDTVKLTAQSHVVSFMAQAASTTNNSVGQALETLAKKQ